MSDGTEPCCDVSGAELECWWRKREEAIDLYKFWLDMVMKVNLHSLTIVGALVAYTLAHGDVTFRFAGAIVFVICGGVAIALNRGAFYLKRYIPVFSRISERVGPQDLPAFSLLLKMMTWFGLFHATMALTGLLAVCAVIERGHLLT